MEKDEEKDFSCDEERAASAHGRGGRLFFSLSKGAIIEGRPSLVAVSKARPGGPGSARGAGAHREGRCRPESDTGSLAPSAVGGTPRRRTRVRRRARSCQSLLVSESSHCPRHAEAAHPSAAFDGRRARCAARRSRRAGNGPACREYANNVLMNNIYNIIFFRSLHS